MTMQNNGNLNPWANLLEQVPEAAYYSSPAGQSFASGSPRQRSYFENQFSNIYNQYLGALGTEIRAGGGLPETRFQDYLENVNPYQGNSLFQARYGALTPNQRGDYSAMNLAPRTRFMYY